MEEIQHLKERSGVDKHGRSFQVIQHLSDV